MVRKHELQASSCTQLMQASRVKQPATSQPEQEKSRAPEFDSGCRLASTQYSVTMPLNCRPVVLPVVHLRTPSQVDHGCSLCIFLFFFL